MMKTGRRYEWEGIIQRCFDWWERLSSSHRLFEGRHSNQNRSHAIFVQSDSFRDVTHCFQSLSAAFVSFHMSQTTPWNCASNFINEQGDFTFYITQSQGLPISSWYDTGEALAPCQISSRKVRPRAPFFVFWLYTPYCYLHQEILGLFLGWQIFLGWSVRIKTDFLGWSVRIKKEIV